LLFPAARKFNLEASVQTPKESGMNPAAAFAVLAKEINVLRERSAGEEALSAMLAAQITRQRAALEAVQADLELAMRTVEQCEPQPKNP
jgi:hypothetical protein